MTAYFDHAATTPLDPAVLSEMLPYLTEEYGNPSSLHERGRAAREAVEQARARVAAALAVAPGDVVFTAGGTEADNLALAGLAWSGRHAGRGAHLVTTAIEHAAVLGTARWLAERHGFTLDVVPPEADGVVDPERLLAAVRPDTVAVSVMAANNEIGTVQPIEHIGPELRRRGVPLHCDAVQAFGRTALDVDGSGIAALALSAHKFNGPKGVGVLVAPEDLALEPVLHGGGQERDLRSGTVNTAGVVGCGAAAERAVARMPEEVPRLRALRDRLLDGLLAVDGVRLNGARDRRLPHNAHVSVTGCPGAGLLLALDAAGIAASTGSACSSHAPTQSHVLTAIGAPEDRAHLRFTCGLTTTGDDVDRAIAAFAEAVDAYRSTTAAVSRASAR